MHNYLELIVAIKKILANPFCQELSVVEVLENFARGSFGILISQRDLKKLGGKELVQKHSNEILNKKEIINLIIKNHEKTSKK